MVANIRGYTPNYGLKLINFDTPRWHTLEYSNWQLVDAIMASTGLPGLRGEWINSTSYIAGERVFDNADGKIYGCLVSHTSAATGTFSQDRALHPTYWMLQTLDTPRYRGSWAPSVAYSIADIVFVNSYVYYICIANHTSGATFPPDAAKWSVVFDATAAVNSTNASATAAAGSASAAAISETNAATSATNAATSATDSAAQAQKLFGTSTSSVVVGVGGKTFITQASKYFNVGKFVMVRANADPVNQWMWGQVTSYAGTSLVINALTSGGSGTFADWIIDVSGSRGAIGPQGPQGDLGPPLVIKGTVPTAAALPPTGNTLGDMYIAEDTQNLHIWDGTMWDNAGPLGTSTTTTADNAPSNPKDGDMWWESDTGIFWVRYDDGNTSQWVQAGGAAASINQNAVLKTGDTMTGNLSIDAANAAINLQKKVITEECSVFGWNGSLRRWKICLADNTDNFYIQSRNDDGTAKQNILTIDRVTGNVNLTTATPSTTPTTGALTVAGGLGVGGAIVTSGDIYMSKSTPFLTLNAAATSQQNVIFGRKTGLDRWAIVVGNSTAESSTASGSDFVILRYDNAGGFIGSAFSIERSTGSVGVFSATPSVSPQTGALTVAGGLGVGGAINSGSGISTFQTGGRTLPNTNAAIKVAFDGVSYAGVVTRSSVDNAWHHAFENTANAVVGSIVTNNTTTAYQTSSDAALKEDLKSFDAGNIIDNTNVYDFKWKSTQERAYGVVAQEAYDVYPTAVTHTEAAEPDEKNNIPKRDEWWGIDYSKYVPVLLQELKALRERVAVLEGRTTPISPKGKK